MQKAFKQFERANYKNPNARRQFAATICNDFAIRTKLEEEVFLSGKARLPDRSSDFAEDR